LARAADMLDELGATPAATLARTMAKAAGIVVKDARAKRGPYGVARRHPLGLTGRETQILELLSQGLANHEIARKITRSQRTVEHHVSSVLGKLNATSRLDVLLRLRNEPWLVAATQ
jgi:DNA-binding NarL/FixJ family response regulator